MVGVKWNWPTTLFQSGDIRFLGETVYNTKNYSYAKLEPGYGTRTVYVYVRTLTQL